MNAYLTLAGACLLCLGLGSVHAFSVFLQPLEQAFAASRADVSLSYSIALISITLLVCLGHRLYALAPGWVIALIVGLGAGAGAMFAGAAEWLTGVWIGYGVFFGAANGLGYGYGLQLSAQANPGREGFAMGAVTAAYALGAMVFAPVFRWALEEGGFAGAMEVLASSVGLLSALAAVLFWAGRARFARTQETAAHSNLVSIPQIAVLWLSYGTAVTAGLMVIGHATGIAEAFGTAPALLVAAPMLVALSNMAGSLMGGWMADRLGARVLMAGMPLVSALALGLLALGAAPGVLGALGVVGLIYGAVISVYPAVIARGYGVAAGVRIYGLVFTAWAVAGFGGPWLAGVLYDQSGGYGSALAVAAGLGICSSLIALGPDRARGSGGV